MTTLNVNTIKPAGATLNLGESGDSVVLADDVKVNLVKDVGGNTLWSSNGSGVLSSINRGIGGIDPLISTTTASNTANIAFTLTSDFKEYIFKFINLNPATDNVQFQFQVSTDNGSSYNITTTSTFFTAWHNENDSNQALSYTAAQDQAQGTGYQTLFWSLGGDADESGSGELHLFNPTSTTFVKGYYSRLSGMGDSPMAMDLFTGGYFNTTTALNAINFKMSSGNIDAGKIKMYGIA